jgi:hypothetical protein
MDTRELVKAGLDVQTAQAIKRARLSLPDLLRLIIRFGPQALEMLRELLDLVSRRQTAQARVGGIDDDDEDLDDEDLDDEDLDDEDLADTQGAPKQESVIDRIRARRAAAGHKQVAPAGDPPAPQAPPEPPRPAPRRRR